MADVGYTDAEVDSLSTEQFLEYMNGGDPLGKQKTSVEGKKKTTGKTDLSAAGAVNTIRGYHKRAQAIK